MNVETFTMAHNLHLIKNIFSAHLIADLKDNLHTPNSAISGMTGKTKRHSQYIP